MSPKLDLSRLKKPKRDGILTIDMIPAGRGGWNLRSILPNEDWDYLRKLTYQRAAYVCEICNGVGDTHPVEAHEMWEFSDGVQRLAGLMALCPSCHRVKHLGHTKVAFGWRGLQDAVEHLQKVNEWTRADTVNHFREARAAHRKRSRQRWKLDISWIKQEGITIPDLDSEEVRERVSQYQVDQILGKFNEKDNSD